MKRINISKYQVLAIPFLLLPVITLWQCFQYKPDQHGKFIFDKMNFNPDPEHKMRPQLYQMIKKEYENFTAEELNLPAWSCPSEECGISTINARGEGRAVVKFNTAFWDRSLPATAVQYITLEYRPATAQELEDFTKSNLGLEDYVGKFYNNLPVEKMGVLIDKK